MRERSWGRKLLLIHDLSPMSLSVREVLLDEVALYAHLGRALEVLFP